MDEKFVDEHPLTTFISRIWDKIEAEGNIHIKPSTGLAISRQETSGNDAHSDQDNVPI